MQWHCFGVQRVEKEFSCVDYLKSAVACLMQYYKHYQRVTINSENFLVAQTSQYCNKRCTADALEVASFKRHYDMPINTRKYDQHR